MNYRGWWFFGGGFTAPFANLVSKKHRPIMARILCNPAMLKAYRNLRLAFLRVGRSLMICSPLKAKNKTAI
jgi:hypothetical protein